MNKKYEYLAFLFVSTLLAALGQLFFKFGLNSTATMLLAGGIIAGFAAYLLSTVIYLFVLSKVHLSWAYGVGGLSYIFATVFAQFILLEYISPVRWIGVLVIFVGVVLIGLS